MPKKSKSVPQPAANALPSGDTSSALPAQKPLTVIKLAGNERRSQAQRIRTIFGKYKKWWHTTYECAEFQEPVLFLERRSGDVEFYENATAGIFEFEHTYDGKKFIVLTPARQKKYGFGNRKFRGYYCHEDFPLPLPENPIVTAQQVTIVVEKAIADLRNLKTQEIKARAGLVWAIGGAVALVLGIFLAYKFLAPHQAAAAIQATPAVAQQANVIITNATKAVIG